MTRAHRHKMEGRSNAGRPETSRRPRSVAGSFMQISRIYMFCRIYDVLGFLAKLEYAREKVRTRNGLFGCGPRREKSRRAERASGRETPRRLPGRFFFRRPLGGRHTKRARALTYGTVAA